MNQYNNTNNEIIDASTKRSPQYPLANNPQNSIKTTNYKDWINMCEGNAEAFFLTDEQMVSIVGAAISKLLGFVPVVGDILSFLADTYWPKIAGQEVDTRVWAGLIRHTANLIDNREAEKVIGQATTNLMSLYGALGVYNRFLEQWKQNEKSFANLADEVRTQMSALHLLFTTKIISDFTLHGYESILLPSYASAANLHLLLLRDIAIYGERLGFDPKVLQAYHDEQVLFTRQYTAHCINTYNLTLNAQKPRGWVAFNQYRRDMTLTVLDLIALFPSYDTHKYPVDKKNVKKLSTTEFTREIYTALIEPNPNKTVEGMEASLTRTPHLFTWIKRLDFYTNTLYPDLRYLSANRIGFSYTNSSTIQQSGIYGDSGFGSNLTHQLPINPNIFKSSITDTRSPSNQITKMDFYKTDGTQASYNSGITPTPGDLRTTFFGFSTNENTPNQPSINDYTHFLTYMKTDVISGGAPKRVSLAWAHKSVNLNNQIFTDDITQVPAVKSNVLNTQAKVIKGPGHTGGDLVAITSDGVLSGRMEIQCKASVFNEPERRYGLRIRYAANSILTVNASYTSQGNTRSITFTTESTFTGNTIPTDLKYENLKYKEPFDAILPMRLTSNELTNITIQPQNMSSNQLLIIDRIEFIPITSTVLGDTEKQNLEKVQKAVNDLFTNTAKNALKAETTDYEIDQTANIVECLSDEHSTKEKMILLDEVKYAKQLSQSRNVLQNGDFESDTLGWTTSNNITIQADNPIFKGKYLHMSGARDIDGSVFPTYIYQKIDESKLKPYTRYRVRGFVGSSKELELVVSRYGEEIDAIMNVPNKLVDMYPPASDCGGLNRCEISSALEINQVDYTNMSYPCQNDGNKKHVLCHDRHSYDFHIDTGSVDLNENIGIWVLFKVSSPDGYATLDNLEVVEERSLDGEALARVKHREKKWIHQIEVKRYETQQAYDATKQAMDALFTNDQDEALQFDTTLAQIQHADDLVQSIPYVYNEWVPSAPGMNYDLYVELEARVVKARYLYDTRNVIRNGDFSEGLQGWHVTGNAKVQQIDGVSVLVLSNWSAGVAQNMYVQHNHGYVLRVTAKKEGHGKGYVTLMDCDGNQETLTFTSCEEGYVTKTVDVFPDTDRVRVDIGETEGPFYIESIELICMNG
ncbi:insecticidal delta-endotoxin Cry8Ea1 family protein [Bacillus wiedmannii]|uniref:insecticidal delta-endotoxin Cry8Ea1 family protein n=1 Tax=Bacillus wiedmannii TaxID=1890302 RepID=UPI0018DC8DFA|nr:insecticidal delta-endotoxin Cry8Ea1 family protein [Bacillus wiedmannii]